MRAFGYEQGQSTRNGPLKMEEVTIAGSPDELRLLARFLLLASDQFEREARPGNHLHAEDECRDWPEDWPDVIVVNEV